MVWKGFLYIFRAGHTDFGVGGPKEGGGDWCMICNKFKGTNNVSVNVLYFGCPTQQCNKLVIKPVRYVPIHKDKDIK